MHILPIHILRTKPLTVNVRIYIIILCYLCTNKLFDLDARSLRMDQTTSAYIIIK